MSKFYICKLTFYTIFILIQLLFSMLKPEILFGCLDFCIYNCYKKNETIQLLD